MAPNPRRVRIYLHEKGVEVEKVEHNILAGENIEEAYLKINPWGTLPALELDDGTVIREAPSIFRYIDSIKPEPNLLGNDPKEAAEIETWERFSELQGMAAIGEFFRNQMQDLSGRGLPGPARLELIPELVERGKQRAAWFYEQIDQRLGESEYLGTDRYTVADITAQCAVDFANAVGLPVPESCANIARWHAAVSARPSAAA
jgi:glutathione S-transferase